jgi:AAA domain-containing protein
MPNAKDYRPDRDGLTINVIGEPKAGKSHFARSAAKYGKVFAFLAPEELGGYAGHDIEYEIICDDEWRPSLGATRDAGLKATAAAKFNAKLAELEKRDDVRVVVLDTANATVSDAIWHWVLMEYGVEEPKKLGGNSYDPYVTYRSRLEEVIMRLKLMSFRQKRHIIALWHQDIREYEGLGVQRKESVKRGQETVTQVHWDVARLPMARGGIRQDLVRWFDFSLYVEPVVGSNPHRSKLVAVPPDLTRQIAGVRLDVVKELQAKGEVPNDFGALMEVVAKRYGGGK